MSERPLSSSPVFAARPTVHVNGNVNPRVALQLVALEMCEQEDGLSALEMRLTNVFTDSDGNAGFAFEDEVAIKLGDRLTIYAGEETAPREIFRGLVSGLEAEFPEDASPTLLVLAEDGLQAARQHRRTKIWDHCTIAQVAREVARSLGLTPQSTGLSNDLGAQFQFNESDLAFLRRLLARFGGDLQVVGTELQVAPKQGVQRGAVTLALHSQLRKATALADLAHQVTEITVTGWDAAQGRRFSGRCSSAPSGPGVGRKGSSVLSQALRSRSHHLSHLATTTEAEASALATTAFQERQRRFVTVHGLADGNPALRVGTHVTLEGLGPRFSNTYYITQCRHKYDLNRGYETDFTAECSFLGQP
jgi:phage protein D